MTIKSFVVDTANHLVKKTLDNLTFDNRKSVLMINKINLEASQVAQTVTINFGTH